MPSFQTAIPVLVLIKNTNILIRKFKSNDAKALFNVFYSAVHDIAINDYTDEQLNAWAPADYDLNVWTNKLKILQPFIIENDNEIVGYADIQVNGLHNK